MDSTGHFSHATLGAHDTVEHSPGGLRGAFGAAAARGAALLVGTGGIGVVVLAVAAVTEREVGPAAPPAPPWLLLLLLLAAGGAVGGAVHRATHPMRGAGWGRTAASWCLCAYAALAVPVAGARALLPRWHGPLPDREAAALVSGGAALWLLAASATLFGLLMAETTFTERRPRHLARLHEPAPRGAALTWAAGFFLVVAALGFLSRGTALPEPETRDDARRALPDVRREAERRPNDAHAQLVLGRTLNLLGRFDEALPALERAERLAPGDPDAWNAAGWALDQQRRFEEAVPHLREAVRLDPSYGEAQHNLGWALAHLERMPEAAAAYRNAVRLKPRDAGAAFEYAMLLYERHEMPAALAQAQRAARLEPTNVRYRHAAAWLLRSQGRYAAAKAEFEKLTRLDRSNLGAWTELGVTDYLMQDAPGAAAAFDEVVRQDSLFLDARPMAREMWRAAKRGSTPPILLDPRRPFARDAQVRGR